MKKIKSKNTLIALLILVIVYLSLSLFFTKQSYKYDTIQQKSIPHINLSNIQYEFEHESVPKNDDYSVSVSGFVVFDDITQQPKGLRQYYIIDTEFVSNGYVFTRKFTVEDIVVMPYLPPRTIDVEEMTIKSESNNELILEDEFGNLYFVNKQTEKITMEDVTGDKTRLITDNREYENFIKNLLK